MFRGRAFCFFLKFGGCAVADKPTYEELDSIVKHLTAELDKDKQEKKVLLESEQRYLNMLSIRSSLLTLQRDPLLIAMKKLHSGLAILKKSS